MPQALILTSICIVLRHRYANKKIDTHLQLMEQLLDSTVSLDQIFLIIGCGKHPTWYAAVLLCVDRTNLFLDGSVIPFRPLVNIILLITLTVQSQRLWRSFGRTLMFASVV
jgi:hypothetical protein